MTKYRAVKVKINGIVFDSKKEARRWLDLELLEKAGEISDLKRQPSFELVVNGQKICTYIADFSYFENGEQITEDVKGFLTPSYRLKKKLLKALYNIDVRET